MKQLIYKINVVLIIYILVGCLFILVGCDVEECPRDQMFQDGFNQVTWPDGSVTFDPIWRCP